MKKTAVKNNLSEKVKNVSRGKHGTERVKVPTSTCTLPNAAASISGGQTGVDSVYTPQGEVSEKAEFVQEMGGCDPRSCPQAPSFLTVAFIGCSLRMRRQ